jgi:hypothetical protein
LEEVIDDVKSSATTEITDMDHEIENLNQALEELKVDTRASYEGELGRLKKEALSIGKGRTSSCEIRTGNQDTDRRLALRSQLHEVWFADSSKPSRWAFEQAITGIGCKKGMSTIIHWSKLSAFVIKTPIHPVFQSISAKLQSI